MAEKETKKKTPKNESKKSEFSQDEILALIETADDLRKERDELSDALDDVKADCEKAKDAHLRACAEYENYRKRTSRELSAAGENAKADTLAAILPVLDNFERAVETPAGDLEAYAKGVEMILQQLRDIVASLGVEAFGEPGETFDPTIHNAVMHLEDPEKGEKEITDVFIKGYKLGDKVIRPASVRVAN